MQIETTIAQLVQLLGDRLSTSVAERNLHGQSETYFQSAPPDAVAFPNNTQEVAQIAKICAANHTPIIAWGVGTSLEGHTLALFGGITVDFRLMASVVTVNSDDMTATVQPGITREDLSRELRDTGLMFPIDPGANATIGGMASTRASGTTAVRYGTMKENVLALEVVLADGRIIRTGSQAKKSAAGYDLTALMVGSEGTLGLITELTLRLHGQPETTIAGICAFDTIEQAVSTVIATIQFGIPMARIEFVDAATVEAFNQFDQADMPVKPHLMVEFHGTETAVQEQASRFGELVADAGGSPFRWSQQQEERNALWKMRHNAYYAVLASRPGSTALVTDICVPISKLAQAVSETQQDIDQASIPGPILGHVGDGNLHALLLVEPGKAAELSEAKDLAHRMTERALKLGGTITGEHGIGVGKMDLMSAEHGEGWQVMSLIKQSLDPKNILNPGKMVNRN